MVYVGTATVLSSEPEKKFSKIFIFVLVVLGRDRLETRMSDSTLDSSTLDLITLKLKFKTVKPASKQVSRFRVLFTRPLVLSINTSINFLLYLRNHVID